MAVQYVDYTLWQRAQLGDLADSDSPIAAQLAYWEQALAGMPERLAAAHRSALSAGGRLPRRQCGGGLAGGAAAAGARVAREHNATSFMVIQAALAVLLSKLSASPEVAVGFPIAGRRDPALDELVGFFVNTLVLRVDLAGDPTVAELLAQVRAAQPGRLRAPRRALRGAGGAAQPDPIPDPSPADPGDVGLAELPGQDNDPAAGLALGDLQVTPLPADTHTARMDLTFSLAERWSEAGEPAGIGGAVEFRTDVFDAASIEALIERLRAGVGGDDRRPDTAAVVGGSAGCR